MGIFHHRPVFSACMSFIAFSVIGFCIVPICKWIILAVMLLLGVIFLLLSVKNRRVLKEVFFSICLACLGASLALSVSLFYYDVYYRSCTNIPVGEECNIKGKVTSERFLGSFLSRYEIDVRELNGEKRNFKAVLNCNYESALSAGDIIEGKVTVAPFREVEGDFNEKLSALSDGILVQYTSDSYKNVTITSREGFGPLQCLEIVRQYISSVFDRYLNDETESLTMALFLGDRSLMPAEFTRDFARAGVSHILALSGLHMTVIMGILAFIMTTIRIPPKIKAVGMSFIAVFYLALTGFPISATRAVLMLLTVYLSGLLPAHPDSMTTLSAVGALILAVSPYTVADAAFWMSFGATFGILAYMPAVEEGIFKIVEPYYNIKILSKPVSYILQTFAASVFAIIPMMLILCIFIHEVSLFSVISSVLLAFPSAIFLFLSMLLVSVGGLPHIASATARIMETISEFMTGYCASISEINNVLISLNYSFLLAVIILLFAGLCISLLPKYKIPALSIISPMVSIAIMFTAINAYTNINSDKYTVSYLNTETSGEIMAISNHNDIVICDLSNGSKSAYRKVTGILPETQSTEIKGLIITDYNSYLATTLDNVMSSEKVRRVWLPIPEEDKAEDRLKMCRLMEIAYDGGAEVYLYGYGDSIFVLGEIEINVSQDYIKRSKAPITLLTVVGGGDKLTYVSSAYNESSLCEDVLLEFSDSECIVFGSSGPKASKGFELPDRIDKIKDIVFSSYEQLGLFSVNNIPENAEYIIAPEIYNFVFTVRPQ